MDIGCCGMWCRGCWSLLLPLQLASTTKILLSTTSLSISFAHISLHAVTPGILRLHVCVRLSKAKSELTCRDVTLPACLPSTRPHGGEFTRGLSFVCVNEALGRRAAPPLSAAASMPRLSRHNEAAHLLHAPDVGLISGRSGEASAWKTIKNFANHLFSSLEQHSRSGKDNSRYMSRVTLI